MQHSNPVPARPFARLQGLALAACVALAAAPAARAGSVHYVAAPVTGAGFMALQPRSINSLGEVALWERFPFDSNDYYPRVWTGAPLPPLAVPCCVANFGGGFNSLYVDDLGAVFGVAHTPEGLAGVRLDRASGLVDAAYGVGTLPTGQVAGGGELWRTGNDAWRLVAGVRTPLEALPRSDGSWGYAGAGRLVVGKSDFNGLGYATLWDEGQPTLLVAAPSIAYAVNAKGQWAGLVGSGISSEAVLGGPGGVVQTIALPPHPAPATMAIAISDSGQLLAGRAYADLLDQPFVYDPYLHGGGQTVPLGDLAPGAGFIGDAYDMNRHGQILVSGSAGIQVLTPSGLLSWVGKDGGSFTDAANWDGGLGFAPTSRYLDVRFAGAEAQTARVDSDAWMRSLVVGDGAGRSTLELLPGTLLRAETEVRIDTNGALGGSGRVQTLRLENRGEVAAVSLLLDAAGPGGGVFDNVGVVSGLPGGALLRAAQVFNGVGAPGTMRVAAGEALRVEAPLLNRGEIRVIGGRFVHAGPQPLRTEVGGTVFARGATLDFEAGAVFAGGGQLLLAGGASQVNGSVRTQAGVDGKPGGRVLLEAGTRAGFGGPLHNDGEVHVAAGSSATFQGLVSGAGGFTGSGSLVMEGGFAPGNSPALVRVEGDLTLGANSPLVLELGGTLAGLQHDQLAVQGTFTLSGGPLEVLWWGGYKAGAGDRFDLLDWGQLQGSFGAINLPVLAAGLEWNTSRLYVTGELAVMQAVPEPGAAALLLAGIAVLGWRARRQGKG